MSVLVASGRDHGSESRHVALVCCRLMKQLAADCSLMEELRVMDYSLLLGVHYRSPGYASSPQVTDKVHCCIPCHYWAPLHAGTFDCESCLLICLLTCVACLLARCIC